MNENAIEHSNEVECNNAAEYSNVAEYCNVVATFKATYRRTIYIK